ncbi:hypothetical protein CFOL_v3_31678 [Cephalotus follicularis]|uniref:Putative plant transposon protein domain-containing protein n=1 Tax=Cephalotus follicularis TaxID=3775 RepID=A0A1Q3D735_CEPFO|nr:hypothetical protein CFOL_v3_31678 [Cephalotus follicularis]
MALFDYLCSSHNIYPMSVKLFYANLEKTTTCVTKSFILGNHVKISPEIIVETLGIPCSGITHFNDIEKSDALEICLQWSDFNPLMTVTSSHLPIATHILLLIVTNTLLPRKGLHTLPSERGLKPVACIKNGTLLNLPYLIISHMCHTSPFGTYIRQAYMVISGISINNPASSLIIQIHKRKHLTGL